MQLHDKLEGQSRQGKEIKKGKKERIIFEKLLDSRPWTFLLLIVG